VIHKKQNNNTLGTSWQFTIPQITGPIVIAMNAVARKPPKIIRNV
jgi:hypothetical protein